MDHKIRQRLFGAIRHHLQAVQVDAKGNPDFGEAAARPPLLALEETHFSQWMSQYSMLIEILWRTSAAVRERAIEHPESVPKEGAIPLEEMLGGESELARLTDSIVAFLSSIPFDITFWAHLRGVSLALPAPIQIGDLRLRTVRREDPPANVLARLAGAYTDHGAELRNGDLVLEIPTRGYSSGRIGDYSPTRALSVLKQFVVLAGARGVLDDGNTSTESEPTPLLFQVADGKTTGKVTDVPLHMCWHVDSYCLGHQISAPSRGLFGLAGLGPLSSVGGRPRTEEERASEVANRLATLASVFTVADRQPRDALTAAAEWYFDSRAEKNQTTAFLFACLGLEALLGEHDEELGTKKLLANRVAYLLGRDRREREGLVRQFVDFYDTRSAIVHGRAVRLDPKDRHWLTTGQAWLRQTIEHEVSTIR